MDRSRLEARLMADMAALAASEQGVVRMKPQNLLINLPLHEA